MFPKYKMVVTADFTEISCGWHDNPNKLRNSEQHSLMGGGLGPGQSSAATWRRGGEEERRGGEQRKRGDVERRTGREEVWRRGGEEMSRRGEERRGDVERRRRDEERRRLTTVAGRLQTVLGHRAPPHREDVSGVIATPVIERAPPAIEGDEEVWTLDLAHGGGADQVGVLLVHSLQLHTRC